MKPDLAEVLAEVNRLRAERGMVPLDAMPKGDKGEPDSCVIARAFNGSAGLETATPTGQSPIDPLPQIVTDFISAFDAGRYPELVA